MNLFLTALLFFLGTISFSQSNDPITQIRKEAPEIGSRTVAITIDDVPNTRLFVRDGNQSIFSALSKSRKNLFFFGWCHSLGNGQFIALRAPNLFTINDY